MTMAAVRACAPPAGSPTFIPAVTYSGSLVTDIWKQPTVKPGIIFLHGGGWDAFSRNTPPRFSAIAEQISRTGLFTVFNADYTLTGGAPQTPITDVKNLVAWVRTNAAAYNVNSSKVAVVGISSGAHLGVMAGIQGTIGTSRPDAVVGWSTPGDLEEAYSQGNGPETLGVGGYLNVALSGNEAAYRLYSPVDQITSNCCPLRLVHSDTENTLLGGDGLAIVQMTSLATAAAGVGVSCTTRTFASSTIHGFFDMDPVNDIIAACSWLNTVLA